MTTEHKQDDIVAAYHKWNNAQMGCEDGQTAYKAGYADGHAQLVAENKSLREALQAVDKLWGGDEGLAREIAACRHLGADFPVTRVWAKVRAALQTSVGNY